MIDQLEKSLSREEARQAMKNGNKVTHLYYSLDEYLEMKNGKIVCENGYDMTALFNSNLKEREWQLTDWFIKS